MSREYGMEAGLKHFAEPDASPERQRLYLELGGEIRTKRTTARARRERVRDRAEPRSQTG